MEIAGITYKLIYLQFVFFPIHNDSCNLLIHEDQDKGQDGRNGCGRNCPPGVQFTVGADKP